MTMLNYDPTQGSSTPRLPSEGRGTTAPGRGFISGGPVPGLGSSTMPSYNQALQFFQAGAAPQLAAIDLTQAQSRNQIAALQAQLAQAQGNYGQNVNLANRGYNLGLQEIDLQRAGVERDDAYYNNVLNLLTNHTNAQYDAIRHMADLANQDYVGAMGYQDTLLGLANQLLDLQRHDRETTYGTDTRNQRSEAVVRGAIGSQGLVDRMSDLWAHYDTDLQALQNQFAGRRAGFEEAKRNLTNQYLQLGQQFTNQEENIRYGFEREQASLWREQDANADQRAALDLKAQELGLSRDQTIAQLSQGLQNMQLSNTININDLTAAMSSGDVQRQIIAQQVMNQALQLAGPPPPPPNPDYQSGGGSYVRQGRAF